MMRAGFRFISLSVSALLIFSALPQTGFAGDRQTIRTSPAKEPFKDLPGVKLPQKSDDEPKSVCTSYIGQNFWAAPIGAGAAISRDWAGASIAASSMTISPSNRPGSRTKSTGRSRSAITSPGSTTVSIDDGAGLRQNALKVIVVSDRTMPSMLRMLLLMKWPMSWPSGT